MPLNRYIPVFIASPQEMGSQREAVKQAIKLLSGVLIRRRMGVHLAEVDWQDFPPIVEGDPDHGFQDRLLDHIRPHSIFVGIFGMEYGTRVAPDKISRTHKEINYALKHRDVIKIMQYFQKLPQAIPEPHLESVLAIKEVRKQFDNEKFGEFESLEKFQIQIIADLLEAVLWLIEPEDARRLKGVREFFRLGMTPVENRPSVKIVCPQIHKHEIGEVRRDHDWRERLLPNVVYEDYRAIDKIRLTLRDVGISDVVVRPPALLHDGAEGNRIWLCLPRNEMAREELAQLGDRVKFKVRSRHGEERCIDWSGGQNKVCARSPLSKYLAQSRPDVKDGDGWKTEFGQMYGVDYAVISRFNVGNIANRARTGQPFYHYYIAGIRGLGTWGAGWYIDHYIELLAKLSRNEDGPLDDFQILLRIEYKGYQIKNVEDVSNKDQAYFDEQYSDEYVRSKA